MKRILIISLVLVTMFVALAAQPPDSEARHRRSAFFVAAGAPFPLFPTSLGFTTFSRHSAFSVGFSGFWPGYYYPYYVSPGYYPAPVYYEPVYDDSRYYRDRRDDTGWVKDAEEFLRGGSR